MCHISKRLTQTRWPITYHIIEHMLKISLRTHGQKSFLPPGALGVAPGSGGRGPHGNKWHGFEVPLNKPRSAPPPRDAGPRGVEATVRTPISQPRTRSQKVGQADLGVQYRIRAAVRRGTAYVQDSGGRGV